jgi:hypothetical protein
MFGRRKRQGKGGRMSPRERGESGGQAGQGWEKAKEKEAQLYVLRNREMI